MHQRTEEKESLRAPREEGEEPVTPPIEMELQRWGSLMTDRHMESAAIMHIPVSLWCNVGAIALDQSDSVGRECVRRVVLE